MAATMKFTMLFRCSPSLCRFLECLLGGRVELLQDLAQKLPATAPDRMGDFAHARRALADGWPETSLLTSFVSRTQRYKLFDRVVEVKTPRTRNPEQGIRNSGTQGLVLNMLRTLPEDQRVALLLREHEH
jgi:DNA-directed RNA polymerase specialized sigma24 family protein